MIILTLLWKYRRANRPQATVSNSRPTNVTRPVNSGTRRPSGGFTLDLRDLKVLGTGRQIDGLYYFNEGFVPMMALSIRILVSIPHNRMDLNHSNLFDNLDVKIPDTPCDEERIVNIPNSDGSNSSQVGSLTIDQNENVEIHFSGSNGSATGSEMAATLEDNHNSSEGDDENIQDCHTPKWAWTKNVSGGVTPSYFKHKARENDH
ncbi:hypothetical protein Tco_0785087 [Tanacetum coccineum]